MKDGLYCLSLCRQNLRFDKFDGMLLTQLSLLLWCLYSLNINFVSIVTSRIIIGQKRHRISLPITYNHEQLHATPPTTPNQPSTPPPLLHNTHPLPRNETRHTHPRPLPNLSPLQRPIHLQCTHCLATRGISIMGE